jgi:disulfide bond formation protein DsbB
MEKEMNNETITFSNPFLAKVFNFFSLAFGASFIGLGFNFIINNDIPFTHLYYLLAMLISLVLGVVVNVVDKKSVQRQMQYQIDNLLG